MGRFVALGDALKKHASAYARFALSQVAAVTALGLAAGSAWGLGLGKLTVQSALGETLRAEIDVSSLSPEEASSLKLRVAPPESYRASGLDYNGVLASTQVQLARRADGRPYLRLTSDRAIQEPFVDVILELNWSSGRLTREFTLLFDPPSNGNVARAPEATTSPVISAPAPSPAAAPVARTQPPVASAPATPVSQPPAPAVTARAPRPAPAPSPDAAPGPNAGASEYTVKPGDTLSRIAGRTQPSGVSLDQMLVGLYRSNPDAFINSNMNRLKSGAVLSVPGSDTVQSITPQEARRVIQAQSSDFGGYRQRLAEAAPTLKPDENARQAKGSVQAAVEDRKPATSATPDKLTLSKPKTAAAEAKVSKETEKKDSAARVAELTRNVEELKKLSAATKASAPAATTAAAPALAPAPAPAPAPAVASAPAVNVAANVPAAQSAASAASAASAPSEPASAVAAVTPASAPVAASAPRAVPAPKPEPEEPGFLDSLTDYLPAIGAVLLVVVGGIGYNRWRARRDAASRSETAFAESRLAPDSFFGHSGGQRVDTRDASTTGQSSMSYSLSQLDAIGDVDPVAEADVYLAYGRDLQAEEILKEALRANPERLAIRLKLLEVYGKRRDIKGFEQLSVQLYAETKGQGEDWLKVQELGRQVDPDNPLYQPGGAPTMFESDDERPEPMNASTLPAAGLAHPGGDALARAAATAAAGAAAGSAASRDAGPSSPMDLDLDLDLGSPPAPARAMAATQALPSSGSQAPMNMDLDLSTPSAAPAASNAHELEFDLGDLDDLGGTPAAAPAAQSPDSLDFDLSSIDLDLPATAPASRDERTIGKAGDIEDIPSVDLPDLDALPDVKPASSDTMSLDDLGVDLDSIDPNDDEALQRQLELAEEFRQIGDTEGARDVLQELVGKAGGPLRDRAQQMLDQLR